MKDLYSSIYQRFENGFEADRGHYEPGPAGRKCVNKTKQMTMLTLEKNDLSQPPKSKKHELIPDFLIIGAGKCGTTSLYMYLRQHPDIYLPKVKEPNFYGYENRKPADFGEGLENMQHFRESVTDFESYTNLFRQAAPGQVKGEMSNTYMYHEQAPERIRYYNPDMKLIAILRQPAGRLYSRFLHLARENRTPTKDFADCMNKDSIWWKRNDLIREGYYYKNLLPYFALFPRENIRIYLYEELNEDATSVLRDIFGFLQVDVNFQPDLTTRFNQSGIIKNKLLNKIYGQRGLLTSGFKALFSDSMVDKVKQNAFIQKAINNLRGKNLAKPKPDAAVWNWLTQEVYGEDIRQLQEMIGKDLRHWLKPKA